MEVKSWGDNTHYGVDKIRQLFDGQGIVFGLFHTHPNEPGDDIPTKPDTYKLNDYGPVLTNMFFPYATGGQAALILHRKGISVYPTIMQDTKTGREIGNVEPNGYSIAAFDKYVTRIYRKR